jgi:hypothetical protein
MPRQSNQAVLCARAASRSSRLRRAWSQARPRRGSAVTARRRAQVRVDAAVCGARQGRAPAAARRRPGAPRGRAGAGAAAPALAAAGRGRRRPPTGFRRGRPGRPGRRRRGGQRRGGRCCAAAGAARPGGGRRRGGGGRRESQAARRRAGPWRRRRGRRRQPLPGRAALGGPARAGVRGMALVRADPLARCAPRRDTYEAALCAAGSVSDRARCCGACAARLHRRAGRPPRRAAAS